MRTVHQTTSDMFYEKIEDDDKIEELRKLEIAGYSRFTQEKVVSKNGQVMDPTDASEVVQGDCMTEIGKIEETDALNDEASNTGIISLDFKDVESACSISKSTENIEVNNMAGKMNDNGKFTNAKLIKSEDMDTEEHLLQYIEVIANSQDLDDL